MRVSPKSFLIVVTIVIVLFFHLWRITDVPRGLYVDETSIGYNGRLIAQTGRDEHGVRFPIFFKAFGEYKNPLYIYTNAILVTFLGSTEFSLRFTSFLFFAILIVSLAALVQLLFADTLITMYGILAAGFLPWFFNLSRIGFEVIAQPAVVTLAIFLIAKVYQTNDRRTWYTLLAGFVTGLGVYTYSTARLLTFLFILSFLATYGYRSIRNALLFVGACAIALVPYGYFAYKNPEALTTRFHSVSYIYDRRTSMQEKIGQFWDNYQHYLSPSYLLTKGDTSPRHHSGYRGQILYTILILALIGILHILLKKEHRRFGLFLLVNLIFAPVAAALTTGDSSLRSLLIGLFLVLLSTLGFLWLLRSPKSFGKYAVALVLLGTLILESGGYLYHYFHTYPGISQWAIGGYDFQSTLEAALQAKPEKIIISDTFEGTYTYRTFYEPLIDNPDHIPIVSGSPLGHQHTCVIVSALEQNTPNVSTLRKKDITPFGSYNKGACYF
ncbi:MAG: glycosyltransferase family 39 protein [Nitrososphaera sp.]|nr:glycosyltransferase family 39 protein [Nitrososphaera sp.]